MTIQNAVVAQRYLPQPPAPVFFQKFEWRTPFVPKVEVPPLSKEPESIRIQPPAFVRKSRATSTDFELIDLTVAGDTAAFDVLVTRYRSSIYGLAYRMLRNHDDAADVAQDVFFKAYEALATFRKKSSFHTWLYRIATNSCINYLRKNSVQQYVECSSYQFMRPSDTLDSIYKMELQEVVNEAIERLPEKQKATVMLRVCDGLSHREVSRILHCSVGTAKANYFHAIRNIRRFMKNYITANEDKCVIPPCLVAAYQHAHPVEAF